MTITADEIYLLNHMNSVAFKTQLGTLISNAESIIASEIALADGSMLIGNGSGVAAAVAISHYVFAAGEFTTAGGDTDETITVSGALATDIALVTLHTAGSSPVTIVDAAAAAGQIDVDMSADPSTDHVLSYVLLRAST